MHNPKDLLDENYQKRLLRRPNTKELLEEYLDNDSFRSKTQVEYEGLLAQKNLLAKNMNPHLPDFEEKKLQGVALRQTIAVLEEKAKDIITHQKDINLRLPNAPHLSVPEGQDENDNIVIREWGTENIKKGEGLPDHTDIGALFGLDIEAGVHLAHSRFAVLRGASARLHRALVNLMLHLHTEAGFEECYVPLLVNKDTMQGTGQLPKFEEDLFKTGELYLIPTAEVSLTNLVAQKTCENLPLKLVAHTPCFRQEAGSGGRDAKGIIRQHQFDKVELVRIEEPSQSEKAHLELLDQACAVLEALELPYRVVELCVGDLGFSAQKTFDIEVWIPSQQTFREIASISNCGDFQARRMNAKTKHKDFVHTLNGSGVAVGRALVAFLENHLKENNTLYIPVALRPFLGSDTLVPEPKVTGSA